MEQLTDTVYEWVKVRENIASIRQNALKELMTRERELREQLQDRMRASNLDVINLKQGGSLSLSQRTSKTSLKKDVIEAGLVAHFGAGNVDQVGLALQSIDAHRLVTTKDTLRFRQEKK